MGPQGLIANENLRQHGWRVFRSSTRDRNIPLTGAGRALQRVRIAEALPVLNVYEGVAIPLDERIARAAEAQAVADVARPKAEGLGLGESKSIFFNLVTVTGNPDPVNANDEFFEVGIAPFDGFISELIFNTSIAGVALGYAFRTSAGQSVFSGRDFFVPAPFTPGFAPDYIRQMLEGIISPIMQLTDLRVPVYAGDRIIIAVRETPFFAVGQGLAAGVIGLESMIMGNLSARATVSAYSASAADGARAAREAAANQAKLDIEREKTRRVQIEQEAMTARLHVAANVKAVEQRSPAPAPVPRVVAPKPAPPDGTGKTFVSAWNPSYGMIGYLIPDPPRGGKVNVFDNKYSVFDITGRLTEQGPIVPVRSDQDIPPGAQLSPVRSGMLSNDILAAQLRAMGVL